MCDKTATEGAQNKLGGKQCGSAVKCTGSPRQKDVAFLSSCCIEDDIEDQSAPSTTGEEPYTPTNAVVAAPLEKPISTCCSAGPTNTALCDGNDGLQVICGKSARNRSPEHVDVESKACHGRKVSTEPSEKPKSTCCSASPTETARCGDSDGLREACGKSGQKKSSAHIVVESKTCHGREISTEPSEKPKSTCCSASPTETARCGGSDELQDACDKSEQKKRSTCVDIESMTCTGREISTKSPEKPKSSCCSAEPTKKKSCGERINPQDQNNIQVLIYDGEVQNWKSACFVVDGMTCTGCENTLNAALESHQSIANVKSNMFLNKAELSYDPMALSTDEIIDIIKAAGFSAQFQHSASGNRASFIITRQTVNSDPEKDQNIIKSALDMNGIVRFESAANFTGFTLDVTFDPDITGARDIARELQSVGFIVKLVQDDNGERAKKGKSEMIRMRRLLIISIIFVIPVVFLAFIFPHAGTHEIATDLSIRNLTLFVLATPIQLYVGAPIYRGAWNGLVLSRELNMDSLVILSTSCAYFYSTIATTVAISSSRYQAPEVFFETSAILMTLIILGRYLQAMARGRAADALNKLKNLQSPTANLVVLDSNGNEIIEKIESGYLQRRDIIKILPSDKIPADGVIVWGAADVDESNMTGESVPVGKGVSDEVMGGSININGTLMVRVTRVQSEGKLSDITNLVEQAQGSKSPSQAFADKIATWFTPFVIVLGIITYVVWLTLGLLGKVDTSEYPSGVLALTYSVAVLVVSCPCAIALAVPTVIVVGTGVGARNGVLVKDGGVFEESAAVTHVVFDKTGTLTQAVFQVADHLEIQNSHHQHAYDFAVTAASNSEHPLSRAVAEYCQGRRFQPTSPELEESTAYPGFGILCRIGGVEVRVGKVAWVLDANIDLSTEAKEFLTRSHRLGRSIVAVSLDLAPVLLFALADGPRPEAAAVVNHIKMMGLKVHIISGDHQAAVDNIALHLGIDPANAFGDCTPSDKLARLVQLQRAGYRVAFCGDGTNDAPVLAQAHVGVAMGAGTSSNVAIATASVVLLTNDLKGMVTTLDLARHVMARIRINFAWAFFYNLLVIPLAAGCFVPVMKNARIPPALAGLGELVSVMPVLAFALLLKRYRVPNSLVAPPVQATKLV